ncbi:NitT/TauT family transport system ATP-binding protein [Bradyrhizobium japonicum]|jgi:NitT/TauT family transport system ATP-binding protein|uniref:NitT/TauT family transport system ATP-binding protein n=1 Tax=Bradyrhizobium elkanii TaxID=29448 RepID=A0ABV4F9E8_BRAEL|nr:ABC transporter ATP-binding protein [Bradyrhizobium elkanii]MBP2432701.1 NitT/TauT family transport system ATP-binding protein [Bradyrhizobium elkanii]MCP1733984.1 NitT/TauT family transport system ATP-binding protein [Bradyrhizobium elkanii]MCP1751667.1 NitT/TauT family transport system ATP-binding protein [Bradyrhizobium elkanii]MCP1977438.1 NitT/TauT family transport system ATP-binding protein [Bradyrhizobium elkanii]MCS3569321.1 NitT/TauT family transport system ATP-binding protein [Bra
MTSVKISFDKVRKEFVTRGEGSRPAGRFTALEDITFDVRAGEFLALVGPSGCGKSTLLDLLGGLATPTSGRILLDGRPIVGPGRDRGVVFQQYALFPWRTAAQNVEFGLDIAGLKPKQRGEIARHFLDLVGLSGFADRYPHELSGGMKQRVAIARSLAYDPEVLLMDEPFAALDAQTRETLQGELLRIWRATGKTIIFITHGIDEAVVLGQRVAVMTSRPGRIKEIVDIPAALRSEAEDVRSLPEFGRVRHEIWSLLRKEVQKAQQGQSAGRVSAGRVEREVEEVAHV